MRIRFISCLASLLVMGCGAVSAAQEGCEIVIKSPLIKESVYLIEVYLEPDKKLKGCPQIKEKEGKSVITLTGFVLKNDPNHILTALHGVVCAIGESKVDIVATNENGRIASGLKVSGIDVGNDIALLDISNTELAVTDASHPRGLTLEDSPNFADAGVCVSSIGNPRNLHFQPSPGGKLLAKAPSQLCTVAKQIEGLGGGFADRHSPAMTAPIYIMELSLSPGDSGSPVFDKAGKVIGMADGSLAPAVERVQWAIPLYMQDQANMPDTPCEGKFRPYRGHPDPVPSGTSSVNYDAIQDLKTKAPPSVLVAFMDLDDSCAGKTNEFSPECILGRLRQFNGKAHGDPPVGHKNHKPLYQEHVWLDVSQDISKKISSVEYTFSDVGPTKAQRLNPFGSTPELTDDDDEITGHAKFEIFACNPNLDYEMRIRLRSGGVHDYSFNLCNVQQAQWPIEQN